METLFYVATFFTALPTLFMAYDIAVNGKKKNFPNWLQEALSFTLVIAFALWVIYFSCNLFV
jgi:hypothetical protein